MKTNKKIICLIVLIFIVGFGLGISSFSSAATNTTYTPMEKIPGSSSVSDFPSYVKAIYKFGIWTIGIAALLMIMIGGFMYMTSAGNNATMGKAKGYITDALIGLVMAMTAYLLLYTINPDLVNIKIKFPSSSTSTSGTSSATSAATAAQNAADCKSYCESGGTDSSISYDSCYSTCMSAKTTASSGNATKLAECNTWCTTNKADSSTAEGEKYNADCLNGCSNQFGVGSSGGTGTSVSDGKCSQIDSAIANNNQGVDPALLKAMYVGGESCNKNKSSAGACGYSQATASNRRKVCNFSGTDAETCAYIQDPANIQADVDCGAKIIKEEMIPRCAGGDSTNVSLIAKCYNSWTNPNFPCGQDNYCNRVNNYYNNLKKT